MSGPPAWIAAALLAGAAAAAERPNFLFVYTDDQRWDAMGCVQREQGDRGRFPWFQTPSMDRLASEGVRFRNAFVVNSLCAPSRASFLTGCYGHRNGVVNNHTAFPVGNVTHATLLRAAGYTTGYIGKWHMGNQSGQRPGFDYSASFTGQGRYFDCPFEINGASQPSQGWVDDVATDFAVDFLRRNRDKPFALVVGFKATHGPFTPPDRAKDRFAGAVARPVPNLGSQAIYKTDLTLKHPGVAGDSDRIRNYFRCVSAADDNLGRLLDALDELQLAGNTLVVYASDNGYYLGEHCLGDKRSAYEESLRIPLLFRYPASGLKGKVVDEMVLNIDLAPTLLDFAGQPIPPEIQGRSWKPLLEGRASDWRRAFFYCYFYERGFNIPTVTAVRTETAKLVKYPGRDDWTELFDLQTDPYEMKNLAPDAARQDLLGQMRAEYERQAKAIAFEIPSCADRPEATSAGPGEVPAPGVVLAIDFTRGEEATAEGRGGKKARRFDGKGCIEIPKSPRLNPAGHTWTVEIVFKADQPNGILLAHGGATNGYCLTLEDGLPLWQVVAGGKRTRVSAGRKVTEGWATVKAGWASGSAFLALDHEPPLCVPLAAPISREPNDTLQIGADLKSPVVAGNVPRFTGLIESVRIER